MNVVWNSVLKVSVSGIYVVEPVRGIDWDRDGHSFNEFVVEERNYEDYMYYCPIPNSEILKFSNLVQNRGWK